MSREACNGSKERVLREALLLSDDELFELLADAAEELNAPEQFTKPEDSSELPALTK